MKFRCLFLIGFFWVSFLSQAQSFETALAGYQAGPGIFLHHDQEEYVPGETIWFKAYVTENGKPFARNTNLFVRLLSPSGVVLSEHLYQVLGATAEGGIELSPALPNGIYQLQAFTNDMMSTGRARQFTIPVTRNSRLNSNIGELILKFYPEGGTFLPGIQNRVAFTAEQNGQPVHVIGKIHEENGSSGTKFQTYYPGLGSFEFIPVPGKNFEAEVEWQGTKKIFSLPSTSKSGIQLRVEDAKDGKSFLLSRVAASTSENAVIILVVEINGNVVFEQEIAFEDYPSLKGGLLTNELPSGILHFTVFDKNKKILAERLSFVDNGEYRLRAEIITKKYFTSPRSLQELEIKLPGENDFTGSIAVIQGESRNSENIISDLLLSSRLKRAIRQPARYLQATDSSRTALDILLQAQQLVSPDWNLVLSGTKPVTPSTPDFITVSGVVMDKDEKNTRGPGRMNFYLEAEDSSTQNYEARVEDNGRFQLDSMEFFGRAKLFYAFTDINEKQHSVKISVLWQNYPSNLEIPFSPVGAPTFQEGNSPDLELRIGQVKNHEEQVKVLERVTLNVKKQRPVDLVEEKYTSGVFRMQAATTLDNINEPSHDVSMSVVDFIRNRINEVELTGAGFVNRKTLSMGTATRWPIGVFLDGHLTTMSFLRTIRVGDVALIKFFDVGWVGVGTTYPGGGIAVFTKQESDMVAPKPLRLDYIGINGFTMPKTFPHINYAQKDIKYPPLDHRHTLYWNPDLMLLKGSGSFAFSFYNNDLKQEPKKVIIQGFDSKGSLLYAEKVLE